MDEASEIHSRRRDSLSALWVDALKILGTFGLGAATYIGSPFSKFLHDNWLTLALSGALMGSLYVLARRELAGSASGLTDGFVRAVAKRDQLTQAHILDAIRKAKHIDMVGFNLRSPWLKSPSKFDDLMVQRLATENDLKLRIVIADPDCESLAERDELESGSRTGRMQGDGNAVKNYLRQLRARVAQGAVQVKFVDADLIRCSLIAADERMFATWYLSFRTGGQSPTFEIAGSKSAFYNTFRQEFDELWRRGRLAESTD